MSYEPCAIGIHVCGVSADELEPVTVANIRLPTRAKARELFNLARQECRAVSGEPCDLVVDLCVGHNEIAEDFPMTRQMLARLLEVTSL